MSWFVVGFPVVVRQPCCFLIAAVLLSGSAFGQAPAAPANPEEFRTILRAVITANRENQARLKSLVAVWSRDTQENGFLEGRQQSTDGQYEMWIDGEQVATRSTEKNGTTEDGKAAIVESKARTAFNGKDFRAMPNVEHVEDIAVLNKLDLKPEHDWLTVISWRMPSTTVLDIAADMPANVQLTEWQVVKEDERQVLRFRLENSEDHGSILAVVDIVRGGSLLQEDWFNGDGQLYASKKVTVEEVVDGLWMPIELVSVSFNPVSQQETLRHVRKLDLEKCVFNDATKIPAGIFDLPIRPEMEVSDYRGATKIIYHGVSAPLPMAELNTRIAAMLVQDTVKGLTRKPLWTVLIVNGLVLASIGVVIWYRRRKRLLKSAGQV